MKTLILLLVLAAGSARAQSTVDWFTLDAAGGISGVGSIVIGSTLGQADASVSTSASYAITGGFWAIETTTPLEGQPALAIVLQLPNVRILWPAPATGFVLQQNADPGNPAGWANVGASITDDGITRSVLQPTNTPGRFYRLRKP